jgi:hypothetical protein
MKVRFLGLGLNSGDGASLNDFMEHMESQNNTSSNFRDYKRFCYVKDLENEKYIAGRTLSYLGSGAMRQILNN